VVQNGEVVRDDEAAALLADDEVSRHYLGSSTSPDDAGEEGEAAVPEELPQVLRGPLLTS
jgi:hypothetical protein